MYDNRKKALSKILEEFEKLSNIVLEQIDIIELVFQLENEWITEKDFKKLESNEKKINKYEVKLDGLIIQAIVLYQPMAKDLRELISLYRMVIDLERVGDLILKIASNLKRGRNVDSMQQMASMLFEMLHVTKRMVQNSLLSFTNKDKESAVWTIKKDETLDGLNKQLLKKSFKYSELPKESQKMFKTLSDVRSVISSIERIGDHATNIAETSIYFLSGDIIRHHELSDED